MVIDPSIKRLFCEGVRGGLDERLFNHLLPLGADIYVQPLGSKQGMNASIEGYLSNYPTDDMPSYVGIRDRDFDKRPDTYPSDQLIPASMRTNAKPIWLTYRGCIENYFVVPELMHRYIHEHSVARGYRSQLPDLSIVEHLIAEAARELADYQAIRWGLAALKQDERWPEIGTSWTRGSGTLPNSLEFSHCLVEADNLIQSFRESASQIDETTFSNHVQEFRDIFNTSDFFNTGQYGYWFHGKDLLEMVFRKLRDHLQHNALPTNISQKRFAEWACENVILSHHSDLQQLVSLLSDTSNV